MGPHSTTVGTGASASLVHCHLQQLCQRVKVPETIPRSNSSQEQKVLRSSTNVPENFWSQELPHVERLFPGARLYGSRMSRCPLLLS